MKMRLFTITITICTLISCKDFISIDNPKNQLITASVFENDVHASAAMTGIYSRMVSTGNVAYTIPFITGIAGDELINYSTNGNAIQLYQNGLQPMDNLTNDIWNNSYNYIYQTNAVIEGCEQSGGLSLAVKKQILGEAHFIRAFWYFYLVNLYSDVPLLLTTDYDRNASAPRNKSSEVYTQIIDDLKFAVENLGENYVAAGSIGSSTDRIRPNRYAAQALLARVHLYTEQWEQADLAATVVINHKALYDTVTLNDVFKKASREVIWQIQTPTTGSNQATREGQSFILTLRPITIGTTRCITLADEFLNAFDSEDKRLNAWINTFDYNSGGIMISYLFPYKLKEHQTTSPTEYSTPLRLGELYLIRAEARARYKSLPEGLSDLNMIRKRAGLPDLVANGLEDFINKLIQERRVEMFAEWGHRWLDLKRYGKIDEVMAQVTPQKGGIWVPYKQWFPIPQRDIESNRNLTQNAGYEF